MMKEHCMECAGHAKRKGETCSTCDGEGNLKKPVAKPIETKKPMFGKKVK